MSRLDSFIRRLEAQRACLDLAARMVEGRTGPIFELGLGNGRTYDHLRGRLPGREIFVFDRQVAAHPDCVPDEAHLFLGGFSETLPEAAARMGRAAVLVHADVGSGDEAANAELAGELARLLPPVMAPGCLLLADQDIKIPGAEDIDLSGIAPPGRYFFRRLPA